MLWQPLRHSRVLALLHNPRYAGAYVYGRTRTRTQLLPGETPRRQGRSRQVPLTDWPVLRTDAHPGYLSWEQFLHNQQRLDDNPTSPGTDRRGTVREGGALLQGIVLCGRCGRRMSVRSTRAGTTPSYECNQVHGQLAGPTCQFVRGDGVDAAVARLFLEAIRPAPLQVSLAALAQVEAQTRQVERPWQLRLERARYQADLARRRFLAVDPENRLVAGSLEREWNAKLLDVEQLEREHAALPSLTAQRLGAEERQRILSLAEELPALWDASTTTDAERKQLLRLLLKDVTLTKQTSVIGVAVRWQTDACTAVEVPRPRRCCDARRTDAGVVERVRVLAAGQTDRQIADLLNAEGCKPGASGTFTGKKVQWIRQTYKIPGGCPEGPGACAAGPRGDGRYSARAAAELLNVTVSTMVDWCRWERLDGIQSSPHGPWWVRLTPEIIARLRKPTRRRWKKRSPKSKAGGMLAGRRQR